MPRFGGGALQCPARRMRIRNDVLAARPRCRSALRCNRLPYDELCIGTVPPAGPNNPGGRCSRDVFEPGTPRFAL